MMATHFPLVFEREDNGVVSVYVAGLPVYAQAATAGGAERAIQQTLAAYLEAHPNTTPAATAKVATVKATGAGRATVSVVSPAALVGSRTSRRKAAASRANGRLGGRPPRAR